MNDALLSGSVDFIAAGPPAFITLWDRTRDSVDVARCRRDVVAADVPEHAATHLNTLDDLTEQDKIAVTAIKVSIPAIIMQMYAAERYGAADATRFDRYTVTMTHPDAVVALLSGGSQINAHFTSPPFHQRERKDPQRAHGAHDRRHDGRLDDVHDAVDDGAVPRARIPASTAPCSRRSRKPTRSIRDDPPRRRAILFAAESRRPASRSTSSSMCSRDPSIKFTTTPENVQKYADFMHSIGSIENQPRVVARPVLPGDPRRTRQLTPAAAIAAPRAGSSAHQPLPHRCSACGASRCNTADRRSLVTATYRVSFDVDAVGPVRHARAVGLRQVDVAEGGRRLSQAGRRRMLLNGASVDGPGPDRAFVFQEFDQLLPWKTVRDNIVFALTASGKLGRREAVERARHFIEKVGLTEVRRQLPAHAVGRHEAARRHRARDGDGARRSC